MKRLAILLCAAALSGCATTSIVAKDITVERTSFLSDLELRGSVDRVGAIEFEVSQSQTGFWGAVVAWLQGGTAP